MPGGSPHRVATRFFAMVATSLLAVLSVRAGGELSWLPLAAPGADRSRLCAWLGGARRRASPGARALGGRAATARRSRARRRRSRLMLLVAHGLLALALAPAVRAAARPAGTRRMRRRRWHSSLPRSPRAAGCACSTWLRMTLPTPERLRRAVESSARALGVATRRAHGGALGRCERIRIPARRTSSRSPRAASTRSTTTSWRAVAAHEIGHLHRAARDPAAARSDALRIAPAGRPGPAWQLAGPLGALGAAPRDPRARARASSAGRRAHGEACGPRRPLGGVERPRSMPARSSASTRRTWCRRCCSARPVHPHLYDRRARGRRHARLSAPGARRSAGRLRAAVARRGCSGSRARRHRARGLPILSDAGRRSTIEQRVGPGHRARARRRAAATRARCSSTRTATRQDVLVFARAAEALAPALARADVRWSRWRSRRQGRCDEAEDSLVGSTTQLRGGRRGRRLGDQRARHARRVRRCGRRGAAADLSGRRRRVSRARSPAAASPGARRAGGSRRVRRGTRCRPRARCRPPRSRRRGSSGRCRAMPSPRVVR